MKGYQTGVARGMIKPAWLQDPSRPFSKANSNECVVWNAHNSLQNLGCKKMQREKRRKKLWEMERPCAFGRERGDITLISIIFIVRSVKSGKFWTPWKYEGWVRIPSHIQHTGRTDMLSVSNMNILKREAFFRLLPLMTIRILTFIWRKMMVKSQNYE